MFDDIPDLYKKQTAKDAEEGWRYVTGDRDAQRPPELLTRDHVARCIVREIREGRGSPHGGVFLDIAWIKEKMSKSEAHIRKKLPSMYHQFKQLAGVDITTDPMEVGPTTHYAMGGVNVDGETQMSSVPGLFAAGEVAAGLHGANRLGGNSLSDLVVFGKLAGEHAANWAREHPAPTIDSDQADSVRRAALEPLERSAGENPYEIQAALQEMMQEKVGIVRTETEMAEALDGVAALRARAANAAVPGNIEYNPGWHTAVDLHNLMVVSEAVARCGLDRRESRGAHFREDYPEKDAGHSGHNTIVSRADDGGMRVERREIPDMPDDLAGIVEEMG